jgi:anti-sigma regulatory factor (Ser/Thr protein kinase)
VGYFHEMAAYDSDDELLQVVVPHVLEGAAAGDPTFVALHPREAQLVREALPDGTAGVTFLPPLTSRARPPAAIRSLVEQVGKLVDDGAEQVRAVNTVPHPGLGAAWDGWRQYEAAINELLADVPVWGLCLYDRRLAPSDVLHDAARTHPHVATPSGAHLRNDRFEDPKAFLRSVRPTVHALEAGPPAVALSDPQPREARLAIDDLGHRAGLDEDRLADLLIATSETVTNAAMHGQPPVSVRAWAAGPRMLVVVNDRGPGPDDPYLGLSPTASALEGNGGFGLWLAHQLVDVTYEHGADGFTVRLSTS